MPSYLEGACTAPKLRWNFDNHSICKMVILRRGTVVKLANKKCFEALNLHATTMCLTKSAKQAGAELCQTQISFSFLPTSQWLAIMI